MCTRRKNMCFCLSLSFLLVAASDDDVVQGYIYIYLLFFFFHSFSSLFCIYSVFFFWSLLLLSPLLCLEHGTRMDALQNAFDGGRNGSAV